MDMQLAPGSARTTEIPIPQAPIDHLVFHAPVPERTRTDWWLRTGVDAVFGGTHDVGGTANWIADLGGGAYLELLGPASDGRPAEGSRAAFIRGNADELFNFAVAVPDAQALADRLVAAGFQVDGPREGGRALPDGLRLGWRTVAMIDKAFGGYIPFAIQWLEGSAHPAETAPGGLRLESLIVEHPQAERLRAIYALIGAMVEVVHAGEPAMRAQIVGPHGRLTLSRLSRPGHGF